MRKEGWRGRGVFKDVKRGGDGGARVSPQSGVG